MNSLRNFLSRNLSRNRRSTILLGPKILLAILLLSVAVLLLAAGSPNRPLTLRLAGDEWFLNSLTKTGMISAFEQKTGIRVEVLYKNDRVIMSDLDHGSSSDDGSLDVIVVRHRLLGSLVQKRQLRPIDSFLSDPAIHDAIFVPQKQLFANWWRELSSYGNHIYGYPFTGLTTYLCYRKDLLDNPKNQREFKRRYHRKLTPPRTWAEYNQIAEFFTRPDQHFYGTYIQGKRGLALWYEWLNLVYSFGGNILDSRRSWDYGDIVVNSPQNVAATREYLKLIAYSPTDTLQFGWNEAQSALQRGHVFMGLLWSDQAPFLEDPAVSKVSGRIGYSLIPSDSRKPFSQLEGLTYLLPTESNHPQEAYKFMEFAMSAKVQIEQTLQGGGSLRKSTYNDVKVRQLPSTATFLAALPVAKGKPTVPESPQMIDAMVARLSEIVSGKSTPQAGLDQLALDLKSILGSKSRLRFAVKTGR
jgi:multiple sugar transport system substrate-binding protein